MKPSPLLSVFAILLIILGPVIAIKKGTEHTYDSKYIAEGITTKAKLELKKDSTGKGADGNNVSFIYVSYRITADVPVDTVVHDSVYLDSMEAMKRMMIAENFKINIPGMKFSPVQVQKSTFDKLHQGDSLKIVYSSLDPEYVRLEEENNAPVQDKNRSLWVAIGIISFIAGIWLLRMNKRRRTQGQESDPLSTMNFYSSVKKDEGPKSGGRP